MSKSLSVAVAGSYKLAKGQEVRKVSLKNGKDYDLSTISLTEANELHSVHQGILEPIQPEAKKK